jgi:hypothetical protein
MRPFNFKLKDRFRAVYHAAYIKTMRWEVKLLFYLALGITRKLL